MILRAGRYDPHRLTAGERRRAREYEQELEERLHDLHTAQKHFQKHCELNRLEPTSIHAFATFGPLETEGDPVLGPIKQGTRYAYLKKVMHALQSTTDPIVAKRRFIVDDAKELAAQNVRGDAPDYCVSVLHALYHVAAGAWHSVVGNRAWSSQRRFTMATSTVSDIRTGGQWRTARSLG